MMPAPPVFSSFQSDIAGIAVAELARRYGTPTFVYDAAVILTRLADLAAFDCVRYAEKACSDLAVLDLLRRHGALVDTVSAGEIRRALAAGYLPEGSSARSVCEASPASFGAGKHDATHATVKSDTD